MKVEVITKETRTYPWVGKLVDYDLVILFTGMNEGIVLQDTNNDYEVGYEDDDWCESNFKPCSVTLSSL